MSGTDWSAALRDIYPTPGTRIKQWVVDENRESDWVRATCPVVDVPLHTDNCVGDGLESERDAEYGPPMGTYEDRRLYCRNYGVTLWTYLNHDSCYTCGDLHEATADRPDIAAWRVLRDARPPITTDRSLLSDEIAPELHMAENPIYAFTRGRS